MTARWSHPGKIMNNRSLAILITLVAGIISAPFSEAGSLKLRIRDACRDGVQVNYRFYDETNNLLWPNTGGAFVTKKENSVYASTLSCTKGSKICIGGENTTQTMSWGVGIDNNQSCTSCCFQCNGKTYTYSFSCSSATVPQNGNSGSTNTGSGSIQFSTSEQAETTDTITYSHQRSISTNSSFSLKTQTDVIAFTYAQYAASFYALDRQNAQACMNGYSFNGYLLTTAKGQSGLSTVTLPAGEYWICVTPEQSLFDGYSNKIGYEVATLNTSGASIKSFITMTGGYSAGGWESKSFAINSDGAYYLEAESTGGAFYILEDNEYKSKFINGGPLPGAFKYIDTCGAGSSEMECTLKIPHGNYYLVYANTSSSWNGFASYLAYAR